MTSIRKILFLIFVSILFVIDGAAQENATVIQNKIILESTDVFLVSLQIDSVYSDFRFKYRSNSGKKTYEICKIKILDIYYIGDSSYVNRERLKKADFMLYKGEHEVLQDSVYNLSLCATSVNDVYFMSRLLSEDDLSALEYYYHAIVTKTSIKRKKICKFLSMNR